MSHLPKFEGLIVTMKKIIRSVLLSASMLVSPVMHADAPVQGTMEAFVVVSQKGKEVLQAADNVEPDQLVEYHLTYVNKSIQGIDGLTVTGPVPDGTSYVTDTAVADVSASLMVSIDGGVTFEQEPVIREVVKDNGEVAEQVIPVDQYTHIQWQAHSELAGKGGTQLYRYRVRVK
ncbi:MAG: hypothetical protein AAF404_00255 [Pseudomonadota bacterium]